MKGLKRIIPIFCPGLFIIWFAQKRYLIKPLDLDMLNRSMDYLLNVKKIKKKGAQP